MNWLFGWFCVAMAVTFVFMAACAAVDEPDDDGGEP
jgi:hypothetical protein